MDDSVMRLQVRMYSDEPLKYEQTALLERDWYEQPGVADEVRRDMLHDVRTAIEEPGHRVRRVVIDEWESLAEWRERTHAERYDHRYYEVNDGEDGE